MKRSGFPGITPLMEAAVVGLITGAIVLSLSLAGVFQAGAFDDDGVYVVLGKALAEGRGYLSLHLVGNPVQEKYPPGFPFILSLLWRVSGSVEGVQRIVRLLHPVVVGATAGLLWRVGRGRAKASRSIMAVLVVMPFLFDASIQYYTIPLSEPWFMLGWAAVLAAWEKIDSRSNVRSLVWIAVAALIASLTVLVRSQAVVLLPALLIALAARRVPWRDGLVAGALMVIPLGWWHLVHAEMLARGPHSGLPDEVAYGKWAASTVGMGTLATQVARNTVAYIATIGSYLSGIEIIGWAIATAVIAAMAIGSLGILRRNPLLGFSSVGALIVVVLWPFVQDRLLLSVMPFAGLAFASWAAPFTAGLTGKTTRALGYAAGTALVLVMVRQSDIQRLSIAAVANHVSPVMFSPANILMANSRFIRFTSMWIRRNTLPTDHVMIENHSGIYLYSGRSTTPWAPAENPLTTSVFARPGQYLANRIIRDSIDYVHLGAPNSLSAREIAVVEQQCPGVLTLATSVFPTAPLMLKVHRDESCLSALAQGK